MPTYKSTIGVSQDNTSSTWYFGAPFIHTGGAEVLQTIDPVVAVGGAVDGQLYVALYDALNNLLGSAGPLTVVASESPTLAHRPVDISAANISLANGATYRRAFCLISDNGIYAFDTTGAGLGDADVNVVGDGSVAPDPFSVDANFDQNLSIQYTTAVSTKIARVSFIQGQSEANGAGYKSDLSSNIPNQSVGYHGHHLRYPYVRPWTTGQAVVEGEVKHSDGSEWEALGAGTCGATAPTGTGDVSDGTVTWRYLRAALGDIPAFTASFGVYQGYVFKTSANRVYQVVNRGVLGASEPTATTATGVTNGNARLKYIGTTTETIKINRVYNGAVRTWSNTNYFKNASLVTTGGTPTLGNGEDADGVRINIGPQIPLGVHMMNRFGEADNFIIKHAVDGRSLGYTAGFGNYSIRQYDEGGSNAYLLTFLNNIVAAFNTLLGTSVTAYAAGQTVAEGGTRKNAGNVYQVLKAGGGTTANAPTHTDGSVTGADGYQWFYLHPVYDQVDMVGIFQEHGAQDSVYNAWAYDFRYAELNLWRRFHHRLSLSSGIYVGFVEPFTPRNRDDSIGGAYKIAFSKIVKTGIQSALNDYADDKAGSAVTVVDQTNHTKYGAYASWVKSYDLYGPEYFNSSVDTVHHLCAGIEAIVDRWAAAFDDTAPTAVTWGGSETTSFYGGGSRPALTITTPPNETYGSGGTVSATLENSGLNGGSAASISWRLNDSEVVGSGLSASFVPTNYNGHHLHAAYKDPNGYWAHWFGFFHVLAPRSALIDYCVTNSVPIKQWMRAGIGAQGASLAANGTIDYIPNYSGADGTINAVRASGVTQLNRHHDGVAMQKLDALRFNSATTDASGTQETAAIATSANDDFTKIVKITPDWKSDDITNIFSGARFGLSAGVNGGGIYLEPSANSEGDGTSFALSVRAANGLTNPVVGSLAVADMADADQQIIAALVKSGSDWRLYYRQQNGTIATAEAVAALTTNNVAYPDVIGWQSNAGTGIEGVAHESIALQHAITDAGVMGNILQQLALTEPANDIPATTEAITLQGLAASISLSSPVQASVESISIATLPASVVLSSAIQAAVESFLLSPLSASVGINQQIGALVEAISLATQAATVTGIPPAPGIASPSYITVFDPYYIPEDRIQTVPDIEAGDVIAYGNVQGIGSVTVNNDGTYTADVTVTAFDVQVWDGTSWGAVATQTVASQFGLEAITLETHAATVALGASISAGSESISIGTSPATVSSDRAVSGALESISLSTQAATVSSERALAGAIESLVLTALPAAVALDAAILAAVESILIAGNAASIQQGSGIAAGVESIEIAPLQAAVVSDFALTGAPEAISIAGLQASINNNYDIAATAQAISLAALACVVGSSRDIGANTESLQLSTAPASVSVGFIVQTEQLTLSTLLATVSSDRALAGSLEALELSTNPGAISLGSDLAAQLESIELSALGAMIQFDAQFSAGLESIVLTELQAQVGLGVDVNSAIESIEIGTHSSTITFASGVNAEIESITLNVLRANLTIPVPGIPNPGLCYTLPTNRLHYKLRANPYRRQ